MFTHPRLLLVMEVCAFPVLLLLYRWLIGTHGATGAAVVTSGHALVKTAVYQILAARSVRRGADRGEREQISIVLPQSIQRAAG
jgi:hypothetical protein